MTVGTARTSTSRHTGSLPADLEDTSVGRDPGIQGKENPMLWTIAVILLILWALGFVSGYVMGGFIHILIVVAVVMVLVRIISGRRPI